MAAMHEIDYKIYGDDMQFVEVELDPMEAVVAEAGGMMFMEDGIQMETIFGDGSQQNSGFLGALLGAGKRLLTGESLFMTVFQNRSGQKKKGRVRRAVSRQNHRRASRAKSAANCIAQKDSFLVRRQRRQSSASLSPRLGAGLFGGEGFIIQRLQGDGWPSSTPAAR